MAVAAIPTAQAEPSIAFSLEDNLVRIPATVNNQAASAVLDSGTGAMIIDRDFANRLKLNPAQAQFDATGGGSEAQPLQAVTLKRIQAIGLDKRDVQGYVMSTRHLTQSAGFPIDAKIGYPIFAQQIISIDYPKRHIVVKSADMERHCDAPIPIKLDYQVPVVHAQLHFNDSRPSQSVNLIVDLGTRDYGVMLDKKAIAIAQDSRQRVQIGTGTGGPIYGREIVVPTIKMGQQTLHEVTGAVTDDVAAFKIPNVVGSLGVPAWKKGTITFDYPHHKLCIELPAEHNQSPD